MANLFVMGSHIVNPVQVYTIIWGLTKKFKFKLGYLLSPTVCSLLSDNLDLVHTKNELKLLRLCLMAF